MPAGPRAPDIPTTASVADLFKQYFREGWDRRDLRTDRSAPLMLSGTTVVADQDILTSEELRRSAVYNDLLKSHRMQWFAAVGFWVDNGLWALVFQRNAQQGQFSEAEKSILAPLACGLAQAASLSAAVGHSALLSTTNALSLVAHPTLALNNLGFVIASNAEAEALFDDDFRVCNKRLKVRDAQAQATLDQFLLRLRVVNEAKVVLADPIMVQRRGRSPIIIRVLGIDGPAANPFLGARALLLLSTQNSPAKPSLKRIYGLTPAEEGLAWRLAEGLSIDQAAEIAGTTRITARNQLRAIFAKTETHRQGELVALLARL